MFERCFCSLDEDAKEIFRPLLCPQLLKITAPKRNETYFSTYMYNHTHLKMNSIEYITFNLLKSCMYKGFFLLD